MSIFGLEVTQSNLTIFFAMVGSFAVGLVALWWRIRQFWFDQEQKYLNHIRAVTAAQTIVLQEQLDAQTRHIEDCIHQTPGHPENPQTAAKSPST